MIWKRPVNLDELNNGPQYIGTFLGIKFTEWSDESLTAVMPVNIKTKQPWGILHGGASVVLAESLGSYASSLLINNEKYAAVGLEVNANHLRPVSDGFISAVCTPFHIGRKTHVWNIKITDSDNNRLVCISRLTVVIIEK